MLVVVVAMLAFIGLLALSYLTMGVDSTRQIKLHGDVFRLNSAAESAIAGAVDRMWTGYLREEGGSSGSIKSFRDYLTGIGVGSVASGPVPAVNDGIDLLATQVIPLEFGKQYAGVDLASLRLVRMDESQRTVLFFTANVASRGESLADDARQRSIQHAFVCESDGGQWRGLEYGLLANNLNCLMCHAKLDSTQRYYNQDPEAYGESERVKVGVLEGLKLGTDGNPDTVLGSTLYVGGRVTDGDGKPIQKWNKSGLQATAAKDGKIVEDGSGNPQLVALAPAGSDPVPGENLYLDYDSGSMVDGVLPGSFPPVIPDDGGKDPATGAPAPGAAGNRRVDPAEFQAALAKFDGSLSGGMIHVVEPGETIETTGELASLGTANRTSLASGSAGNVVLIGTADNPILLNGDVMVQGDVILRGYVKGKGSLVASGNVYVPSDLLYVDGENDGARTFGVAQDGTENGLALAAGGNVVVGDLYRAEPDGKKAKKPITGLPSGEFSFSTAQMALFNRQEWARTQALLPGPGESWKDPTRWSAKNPDYRGADYLPRYYAFTDGSPVPFLFDGTYDPSTEVWGGKKYPEEWKDVRLARPEDPKDTLLHDAGGSLKAVVLTLAPTGSWISGKLMDQLIQGAINARAGSGPLEIDALLYSSNSIFSLVFQASGARMIENGGLVAADIGMLCGEELRLNHDPRSSSLLSLEGDGSGGGKVVLRRSLTIQTVPGN